MLFHVITQVLFAGFVLGAISPDSNIDPANPCAALKSNGIFIFTQADTAALSNCTSITSSVTIDATFPGRLELDQLAKVNGTLQVGPYQYNGSNQTLTELSFPNLASISSDLLIQNVLHLTNLSMPRLSNVSGSVILYGLPRLISFDGGNSLQAVGDKFNVTSTGLQQLTIGYNGAHGTAQNQSPPLQLHGILAIYGNTGLQNLQVNLYNTSSEIDIDGKNVTNINFPGLNTVGGGVYMTNVHTMTMDNLTNLGGPLSFFGCRDLERIVLPQLTNVKGNITFVGNADAYWLAMPALVEVDGSIFISGNDNLHNISGFPNLQTINGKYVHFEGSFDQVSFPALKPANVQQFTITSYVDGFDCNALSYLNNNANPRVVSGQYSCEATVAPASSGGLSKVTKVRIAIGVVFGVLLIVVIIWLLVRLRRQSAPKIMRVPLENIPPTSHNGRRNTS